MSQDMTYGGSPSFQTYVLDQLVQHLAVHDGAVALGVQDRLSGVDPDLA